MTLVGKILTFLILIMSMVFMTFTLATYATHRNWRDTVQGTAGKPGLKIQLDNAKTLLQSAEEEKEGLLLKLERERAARTEALAAKETNLVRLTKEKDELDAQYATLKTEHRKNIATVSMAQTQMEKATNELATLRSDFQGILEDKTAARQLATAERDKVLQALGKLATAEKNIGALRGDLSEAVLRGDELASGVGGGGTNIRGRASVDRDGRVTAVNGRNLVTISIGSDEGLNPGDTLEVWRDNGSYVGRLVVVDTRTDQSVAKIVPKYQQGKIQEGDKVGTKLL